LALAQLDKSAKCIVPTICFYKTARVWNNEIITESVEAVIDKIEFVEHLLNKYRMSLLL